MAIRSDPLDRAWCRRFEALRGQHAHVVELGLRDVGNPIQREAIGRSLATFQLGETGDGEHLLAAAEHEGASADYIEALRCFVAEEQEHARLLALAVTGLGVSLRTRHWTDRAFVAIRRARSLRTAVLTLLVAEVIAVRYYGALKEGLADPALRGLLARVHADELRHIAFHTDTLPPHLQRFRPITHRAARAVWNTLVAVTSTVVAVDHGSALAAAGVSRSRFVRLVNEDRRRVDDLLFGSRAR